MRATIAFGAACAWLLAGAGACAADGQLGLADASAFTETWTEAPLSVRGGPGGFKTVGVRIAGVRLDSPAADYDPRKVQVALGGLAAPGNLLCVRFVSRDGKYSAQGRYALKSVSGPAPVLETRSAYQKQLAAYRTDDMAVFARSAPSCDDPKDADLYAASLGASSAATLVVQLSAGDARVRAQLGQNNKSIAPAVLCESPASGVRVAFTLECRIPLPAEAASGAYQLSIGETASNGEIKVQTYRLNLYRGGARN